MKTRTSVLLFLGLASVFAVPATAAGERAAATSARSVVSLLAPAHGAAFAFGALGHLLTTKVAVGAHQSVKLVTAGGNSETASVVPTSDPDLVQLRGPLTLPALHGATAPAPHSRISIISGPLAHAGPETGHLLASSGDGTSVRATGTLEGAPILDANGLVVGVATSHGRHVAWLGVANLRARPMPRNGSRSPGGMGLPLGAVLAIVFAFGIGVGIARIIIRTRVSERLAARAARRRQPRPPQRGPARRDPTGPDTGVHVVLRSRTPAEPVPDVRLHGRNHESRDAAPAGPPSEPTTESS